MVYFPIGNRNYSIAEFPSDKIANGNKAKRIEELSQKWPLETNRFFNPFELTDIILYYDGLQVLERKRFTEEVTEKVKDPIVSQRVKNLYPKDAEPWQGHGLGKFLAALGVKVLEHTGVTEIDYMGRLSYKSRPIMVSLGYKGALRQKITDYDQDTIREFLMPFVKNSHSK